MESHWDMVGVRYRIPNYVSGYISLRCLSFQTFDSRRYGVSQKPLPMWKRKLSYLSAQLSPTFLFFSIRMQLTPSALRRDASMRPLHSSEVSATHAYSHWRRSFP